MKAMKYPKENWKCFKVEEVNEEDVSALEMPQTSLERAMVNMGDCLTREEEEDLRACLEDMDQEDNTVERGTSFEELTSEKPSEEKKVELKIFPDHLKYVFLEEGETKLCRSKAS